MTSLWKFFPVRDFAAHHGNWQELNLAGPASPLLSPAFLQPLIDEFADGSELIAVCGTGPAPEAMAIVRAVGAGRWETLQPSQAPLGAWLQRSDTPIEMLLDSLVQALPGFAYMFGITQQDPGMPLIVGITQKDPDIHARPADSPRLKTLDYVQTARIQVNRTFEDYWRDLDRNITRQVERRLRRLREEGIEPRLEVITDPGMIPAAVEEFGNIESAGWKSRAGTAVHISNVQGVFYTRLLQEYCKRGDGAVYRYRFGNITVAMELCIKGGEALVMLKTTYDEAYRTHAPGLLMRREILEQVFSSGRVKRIEFLGKLQSWQTKWCDEFRTIYHVNYYRWPWVAEVGRIRRALATRWGLAGPAAEEEELAGPAVDGPPQAASPRTHTVTLYRDLAALPARYDALFRSAGAASLFHTLWWYRNFVRSGIVAADQLRIYAVDAGAKPAARAVLLMHDASPGATLGPRSLTGLSNYYSSLFGPVIEPGKPDMQETLNALAQEIVHGDIRWDTIDLHPLAADSPDFSGLIAAFRNAGLLVRTYFCFGNWYLQVRGRPYSEYFATLPSQLRNTIRRKSTQLERAKARIVIYRDAGTLDEAMHAYGQVHAASWKDPEPYPDFIRGLCRVCAEAGWLRLGVFYFEERPVAAQIWIVTGGTAIIYKLSYDERYARLSAGSLLTAHLMEQVIDTDRVREVDYLTGDDTYKKDWMSDRRERSGIVAFNPHTPYGLLGAARHHAGESARRLAGFIRRFGAGRNSP